VVAEKPEEHAAEELPKEPVVEDEPREGRSRKPKAKKEPVVKAEKPAKASSKKVTPKAKATAEV